METIQTQDTRYLESVGQTDKHQKLSNKYNMVNTSKVIEVFNDLGWFVSKQQQKAVRNPENHSFQKHLVRLQHKDMTPAVVGDTVPELILTGSHDGTSALKISIGAYRLVCLKFLIHYGSMGVVLVSHPAQCSFKFLIHYGSMGVRN